MLWYQMEMVARVVNSMELNSYRLRVLRAPKMGLAGVNTGFLILTGIDKMVSKIKAFLDLYEHSLTAVYTANLCS